MDNYKTFIKKLTDLFEQVEPIFLEATLQRYRRNAEMYHQAWLNRMAGPKPENPRAEHDSMRVPQYTTTTGGSYAPYWDFMVRDIAAGKFIINYAHAERDAREEVASAKAGFVTKNSRKLNTATQLKRKSPSLNGCLSYNGGIVTGTLLVEYGKSHFILAMSIKLNYRNGQPYYQFPAIFQHVMINGVAPKARMSEAWLSENFK